jgi:hypothetical protein
MQLRIRHEMHRILPQSQNLHGKSHLEADLVCDTVAYAAELTVPNSQWANRAKTRHRVSVLIRHVKGRARPHSGFIWPRAWTSHRPALAVTKDASPCRCHPLAHPESQLRVPGCRPARPCSIPPGWRACFSTLLTTFGLSCVLVLRKPAGRRSSDTESFFFSDCVHER